MTTTVGPGQCCHALLDIPRLGTVEVSTWPDGSRRYVLRAKTKAGKDRELARIQKGQVVKWGTLACDRRVAQQLVEAVRDGSI